MSQAALCSMFDNLPTNQFLDLPAPRSATGELRRIGVEIEFSGLTEHQVAEIARECVGGQIREKDSHTLELTDTDLGGLKVYLDTALRDKAEGRIARAGLDLARAVVPVELVTDPLTPDQLPRLDRLRGKLREAGALGSRQGWLLGFGVHFNPQVAEESVASILPVLRTFAMVEDALRASMQIDTTRRILPFVDRYPSALLDGLASNFITTETDLADLYLETAPSRNHALDMLPILAHLDADRVNSVLGPDNSVSARPAYHYRLPDCRIDEEAWNLAIEWNRWVAIERLAQDHGLIQDLCAAWADWRESLHLTRDDWAEKSAAILSRAASPRSR